MCPYEFRTQVPSHDLCWSKNRPPSRLVNGSGLARRPSTSSLCSLVSKMRRAFSEQQRSKVGFPIRKFSDQSLFAAPRNLSQRTTSFIASQRQGIHQIPFWHLIALIAKARFSCLRSRRSSTTLSGAKRPVLLQTHPEILAVKLKSTTGAQGMESRANQNSAMTSRPAKAWFRPIRPSTECASSSRCQTSKGARHDGPAASDDDPLKRRTTAHAARASPMGPN